MKCAKNEAKKLYENILKYSSAEKAKSIAYKKMFSESPTRDEITEWVKYIIDELEKNFDQKTVKEIRTRCYCDEDGRLEQNMKWLKGLYESSSNINEFVDKVNKHQAGWYLQDGYLFTKYLDHCSCHLLEGITKLDTKTMCYCTAGFNKAIFSHVFECSFDEIDVDIEKSIKMGDEYCLIKIALPPNIL